MKIAKTPQVDYGRVARAGRSVPSLPREARAVASPRRPNLPPKEEKRKSPSLSRDDGLEFQQRRWGGRRGRRGADDAGRAVPDQRGAGGAALQVPQGAPGPPRRPQPRGLISTHTNKS